jgi:hypothetical protein
MDSTNFPDFDWVQWNRRILQDAPKKPGIYVFRLSGKQPVQRVKGQSDIVYVGCTTRGKGTIRRRLREHLTEKKIERNTAHYLQRVQKEVGKLEVSWKVLGTHRDAMDVERILLAEYEEDHIEFPPLNRQESGKTYRQAKELVESLPAWKRGMKFSDLLTRLQIAGKSA